MQPLLEVKNLTTTLQLNNQAYPVIQNINFSLMEGKTIAIVGETGCGKSMTALSLLGIAPTPPTLPSSGEVLFKGQNLLGLSKEKMRQVRGRHIGMIFQNPRSALNPVYTIQDQLIETCQAHLQHSFEEAKELAIRVIQEVKLPYAEELIGQYPHQLSGGMLQRVMIAMSLICDPEILIADEPTTALDVTIQKQILDLLKEIQTSRGMGMLLITHDMNVVAHYADEVIVLYAGEVIEQGPTKLIFSNPSHPYTNALFASRPTTRLKQGRLSTLEGNVPLLQEMPTGCSFHPRCAYCMPQCKVDSPPFFPLPNQKQHAKCWLFDPNLEEKVEDEPLI